MAREYRQNTPYGSITDENEQEENKAHGNTGLPFGLCMKYNIPVSKTWTPRDAWNALKGIGIYPPWTEKGKDQYKEKGAAAQNDNESIEIDSERKQIYDHIQTKLGKFSKEYREALEKHLENLDDNEIEAIAATIGKINFIDGSGSFKPGFGTITTPGKMLSDIDKEMGNEFGATTFFHEYGHYLASELGKKMSTNSDIVNRTELARELSRGKDFNNLPEFQQLFAEDAQEFFETACKRAGLQGKFNINRISYDQRNAIWKYIAELTERKDYDTATNKPLEPIRELYVSHRDIIVEQRMRLWGDTREQANAYADEEIRKGEEKYKEAYEKYKASLDRYNAVKDRAKELSANMQRWGFLTDFVGGATHGRFDVVNAGYWGHDTSYWTGKSYYGVKMPGQKNGVETWAEYVSFKMTKDTKGLEMFKRTLPRTFAKYEEVYSQMGGVLKNETV